MRQPAVLSRHLLAESLFRRKRPAHQGPFGHVKRAHVLAVQRAGASRQATAAHFGGSMEPDGHDRTKGQHGLSSG